MQFNRRAAGIIIIIIVIIISIIVIIISRFGLASRLWLLSAATLIASPIALATLTVQPPAAMAALVCYYLFAETWLDF